MWKSAHDLTKDEVLARVEAVVKKFDQVDPNAVMPTSEFADDLGLDSLDAVDLANKLEEQKDIQIEARALAELNTLGDVYALVKALTAKA